MQDNFNIHNWRLNQAIKEIDEATFTDKHDDNPKLKGGQKDLPDEIQAKIVAKEGEDHEVSMAQNSLKSIISSASQLMAKLGDNERNIPGWIQDHIAKAENYIEQANQSFHELESSVDEMFVGARKYKTYMPDEWNYSVLVKLFDEVFGINLQDEEEGKYIQLADLKKILNDYGATHFQSKDTHGNPILPRLIDILKDKGHIIG